MSKYICDNDSCQMVDVPSPEDTPSSSDPILPRPSETRPWTIYGATWCSYCTRAKALLDPESVEYFDIDLYGGKERYLTALADLLGDHKTIPAIFYNGKFIGGYTDLCEYLKDNLPSQIGTLDNNTM